MVRTKHAIICCSHCHTAIALLSKTGENVWLTRDIGPHGRGVAHGKRCFKSEYYWFKEHSYGYNKDLFKSDESWGIFINGSR